MAGRTGLATPDTSYRRDVRRVIWFALFVSGVMNVLAFAVPINMLQVYDRVLPTGSRATLLAIAAIVMFALLLYGLLDALRQRVLMRAGGWLEQRIGPQIIRATLNRGQTGAAAGAEMRDLVQVRSFIAAPTFAAFFDLPWIPLYLIVVTLMHPLFGLLAVGTVILIAALVRLNYTMSAAHLRASNEGQRDAALTVEPIFRQSEIVQAMGMGSALEQRWNLRAKAARAEHELASDRSGLIGGLTKAIRMAAQAAVLWVGAELFLDGQTTGGAMIAASIFIARAIQPVDVVISNWNAALGALDAWRRTNAFLAANASAPATTALPAPRGELALKGASLAIPGRTRPVLDDISVALTPGEVLGLVGPSGSGKSTLCLLMCGAKRPTAGTVRIDGAEFDQWNRSELGRYVGYLAQDADLFAGTIRDNIARFAPAATDEDIIAAAKLVGAHRLILELPEGYDSVYTPGRGLLSRGQRQRIALARAVFGGVRLVILDEPNTHLDAEGEIALMNAIRALKAAGVTVVIAAHRVSLLMAVDRILALREGVLEMIGPRDEILKRYARRREPAQKSLIEALPSQMQVGPFMEAP
jgi:PrtD family type I secretion system ABC transporter